MTEDDLDRVLGILATSASNVLVKALKDEKRFKRERFFITAADEVELREYLKAWAKSRLQGQ